MNPETGTFISMDTYRGNAYDPASLHRYTYAQNNPQMYNDPSGHFVGLIGTCVSSACQSILSSWKGIALNALLGGAVNTIINQVLDTGESEIKSFVKGALVGGGFAAAYIGVCAIAAIFEVQAFVHLGFFVINSISAVSNLVIALAYGVTGNDKQALVHLSIGVLSIIGAFIEFGMSGKITANGARGSATIEVGGNNTSDSKTYYHVTNEVNAEKIMASGELGVRGNRWEARVFAWTVQPTQKQASIAGIGKEAQTVIKFKTNASFAPDEGNATKAIADIVVQTTDGQRVPISIKDIEIVGFKKEWWQFWKK